MQTVHVLRMFSEMLEDFTVQLENSLFRQLLKPLPTMKAKKFVLPRIVDRIERECVVILQPKLSDDTEHAYSTRTSSGRHRPKSSHSILITPRHNSQNAKDLRSFQNRACYPVGGPEKTGVSGSIPSLATSISKYKFRF